MTADLFFAALIFGLLTGFHCIGMCGPIAVSLPLKSGDIVQRIIGSVLYNTGRIVTYMIMGALFGLLGKGIVLAGFQQSLAIAIGVLMILSVLFPFLFRSYSGFQLPGIVESLKFKIGRLFSRTTYTALFLIGILNGLLPCGPVYVAVGLSLASGDALSGAIYMAVFGLGTVPVMLSLNLLGTFFSMQLRSKMRKFVPVFIILLGIWFIFKGMGLGIRYVSPSEKKLKISTSIDKKCCKSNIYLINNFNL